MQARGLEPQAAVQAAVQQLRWRGPDGAGVARAGDFWLGCARLAITQAGSRQPVVRRGGDHVGVLNGALTSARQLWAELLPPAERRSRLPNDAWLPLLGAERGVDWASTVHGHFAAAVVDVARGELRLWRDACGEKPLFVFAVAGQVQAFASTLPALACLGVDSELPSAALAQFFQVGFHGDVRARGGELQAAPPPLPAGPAPKGGLRDHVLAAVRRCTDLQVEAALCLSGGLDSSCLAAALAAAGQRLPAYQFRAAGSDGGERLLAEQVAQRCGLPLRPVDGGPEVLDALPELTRVWGLPLGDPSLLAVHALSRRAVQDGIKVLLSGEGADELLLGYRRHRAQRWLPPRGLVPGALAPAWRHGYLARWLRAASSPDPFFCLQATAPPAALRMVLVPELLVAAPAVAARGDLETVRQRELNGYLRSDLLPKLDVATMAAGIEGRCPYLDRDVVGWAMAQPARAVLGKRPLRAAFAAELPAAVRRGPKRGFALPLDRWFRGALPWLDLLREARTRQRPHLRPGGVDAVLDRHRRGIDLGRLLYLLVAYELWLRAREEDPSCG